MTRLGAMERLEARVLLDALTVTIGDGQPGAVVFFDDDGSRVRVKLNSGEAQVMLSGDNLAEQAGSGSSISVQGDNVVMESIIVSGTTDKSRLSLSVRGGDGLAELGAVECLSPLGKMSAADIDLVGDGINAPGAAYIRDIRLHDILESADIVMNGKDVPGGVRIKAKIIDAESDVSLGAELRSLKAAAWGADSNLTAPSASTISIKGENKRDIEGHMSANLVLSGEEVQPGDWTLGRISVSGDVNGQWSVTGDTKKISVHATGPDWDAVFSGTVARINVKVDAHGSVTAGSLRKAGIKGSLTGCRLELVDPGDSDALGRISVKGWIDQSEIRADGTIGKVTAGGIRNSVIYAGVADSVVGLPDLHTDFDRTAAIENVKVKGLKNEPFAFTASSIAAWELGDVSLADVRPDNGGVPFGLSANSLDSLKYRGSEGKIRWSEKKAIGPPPGDDDFAVVLGQFGVCSVTAALETEPVPNAGDAADDTCIWIHPTDRSLSLIIGTDKKGGLAVYDLSGDLVQYLPDGNMNNIDIRYDFPLGGDTVDILAATNRSANTVDFYRVASDTGLLERMDSQVVTPSMEALGLCMYRSSTDNSFYIFVTGRNGVVEQWEFFDAAGSIGVNRVRSFDVGGECEGCVADDELGLFYVAEEKHGIWKYGAEPASGAVRSLAAAAGGGESLKPDVEGLTLYYGSDGAGYLIASSQGSNEFAVFTRGGDNRYLMSFEIVDGTFDGVSHTDGIDATSVGLGPAFPDGVFIAQDDNNDNGNQNFKLVGWEDIATCRPADIVIDTSWDPRVG